MIAELRKQGCGVIFLSNKPLQPRGIFDQKLTDLGIPTSTDRLINSSQMLIEYLLRELPSAIVFAIRETPLLEELAATGISLSGTPEEIDVVVASFDRAFDNHK